MAKRKTVTKPKQEESSLSTEEKIKEAARTVFTKKGYAATRTRDIAEEAGLNLALLNYYFRSKEKLFELVMMEKMTKFFGGIAPIFNDPTTTLETKVARIAEKYTDLLSENPDLPIFILSEVRMNPDQFVNKIPVNMLLESNLFKQLHEKRPDMHPSHYFMNLLGLCVFPFVMKPVFTASGLLTEKTFQDRVQERKSLIPKWFSAILKTK